LKVTARRGDAALFDIFKTRFESSKVPAERSRYLAALASFRDPALVERSLAYVFAGPLRPQETMSIPRGIAGSPAGRDKAFAWMTANYDRIAERISPEFLVFMPYFAMGCSERRLDAAKVFFAEPPHAPAGTAVELAKVEEAVTDCARLNTREGEAVRRYLAAP
jgi:aminopeptidase 2